MEKPVPMDRLICGDVGYGKTEIAVRAAFKAVQDGKQVAVLVPTTLLAQQHYTHVLRADGAVPGRDPPIVPVPDAEGVRAGPGDGRRHRRHPDRHAPAAAEVDAVQAARAGHRRRGAAIRRRAQGAAEAAAHRGRRPHHVGHADPADPGDGDHRHPGDVHDRDAAGGAAPGAHRSSAATTTSRSPPRSTASCCATARSSTCTTGSSRSIAPRAGCANSYRRHGSRSRTARWARTRWRR